MMCLNVLLFQMLLPIYQAIIILIYINTTPCENATFKQHREQTMTQKTKKQSL